jgi:hypothetical protein
MKRIRREPQAFFRRHSSPHFARALGSLRLRWT